MYYSASITLKHRSDFNSVLAYLTKLSGKLDHVSSEFDPTSSQCSISFASYDLKTFERAFTKIRLEYGLLGFMVFRREELCTKPVILSYRHDYQCPTTPLWLVKQKAHHQFELDFMAGFPDMSEGV